MAVLWFLCMPAGESMRLRGFPARLSGVSLPDSGLGVRLFTLPLELHLKLLLLAAKGENASSISEMFFLCLENHFRFSYDMFSVHRGHPGVHEGWAWCD